jgi:phage terminase large subunit
MQSKQEKQQEIVRLDAVVKPRQFQRDLINNWDNYKRFMCVWPRRCLSGDTNIIMANGRPKPLREIKAGDEILSWNGSEIVKDRVNEIWRTGLKETIRLQGQDFPEILTSRDHLFATKHKFKEDKIFWKRADTLNKHDFLLRCNGDHKLQRCLFKVFPHIPQETYDLETESNHNFFANGYLVHNSGKDIACLMLAIRDCLRYEGFLVYYMLPLQSQARKVIWQGVLNSGHRILSLIPDQFIDRLNSSEMRVTFTNGSQILFVGSNNYDGLLGTNAKLMIFSEFAVSNETAWGYLKPILLGNDGKAVFISTPRGHNFYYDMFKRAQQNPDEWFLSHLTVEETKHIPLEVIQKEIKSGETSEDLAKQEYWCSFDFGVEGAYYTKIFDRLKLLNQIGEVPYNPSLLVYCAWDLGIHDPTAIVFYQVQNNAIYVIDYYQASDQGLEHFSGVLKSKCYSYGGSFLPHDARQRDKGSGSSTIIETATNLGIDITVLPRLSIESGIELTRSTLARCYFDENKCSYLIKCLENYRREFDPIRKAYQQHPLHNWAVHACFVGKTLIKTPTGDIPIKDIKAGDLVTTPFGARKVLATHKRLTNDMCQIKVGNTVLETTPNHKIFTQRGLVSADSLRYSDVLEHYSKLKEKLWQKIYTFFCAEQDSNGFKKIILSLMMKPRSSLMVTFIDGMGSIIEKRKQLLIQPHHYTEQFGFCSMVRYLKDAAFIIKMEIQKIMIFPILNALSHQNIYQCTQTNLVHGQNLMPVSNSYAHSEIKQQYGIDHRKVEHGIVNMQNHYQSYRELPILKNVKFVKKIIQLKWYGKDFVPVSVKRVTGYCQQLITKIVLASFVRLYSFVINTVLRRHVVKNVKLYQCLETEEVYDLTIENDQCYYANGYLVSNSDAFRYLAMSLNYIKKDITAEDIDRLYNQARGLTQQNHPFPFGDRF